MPKGSWTEFGNLPLKDSSDFSQNFQPAGARSVRVQRTRGGKGGKTVTMIRGLALNSLEAKKLLKKLKIRCGTGGTLKDEHIELQGDQVQEAIDVLQKEGFHPKQCGG